MSRDWKSDVIGLHHTGGSKPHLVRLTSVQPGHVTQGKQAIHRKFHYETFIRVQNPMALLFAKRFSILPSGYVK